MATTLDMEKPDLLHWGAGKKALTVLLGRDAVTGARSTFEMLQVLHQGKLGGTAPIPDLRVWLGYYRDHEKWRTALIDAIARKLPRTAAHMEELLALVEALQEFGRLSGEKRGELIRAVSENDIQRLSIRSARMVQILLRRQSEAIQANLDGEDSEDQAQWNKIIPKPPLQFFLRVWVPCLAVHGEYPQRLFRRARLGKLEVLEKLLRIDKAAVADQRIADVLRRESWNSKFDFAPLAKAFGDSPPKLSLRKAKDRSAGFLSLVCRVADISVTSTDLVELFDAWARSQKTDTRGVDPDLRESKQGVPNNPEALTKKLERERKHLRAIFPGIDQDKK